MADTEDCFSSHQVVVGMYVAASEFYSQDKTYDLNFKEDCLSQSKTPSTKMTGSTKLT